MYCTPTIRSKQTKWRGQDAKSEALEWFYVFGNQSDSVHSGRKHWLIDVSIKVNTYRPQDLKALHLMKHNKASHDHVSSLLSLKALFTSAFTSAVWECHLAVHLSAGMFFSLFPSIQLVGSLTDWVHLCPSTHQAVWLSTTLSVVADTVHSNDNSPLSSLTEEPAVAFLPSCCLYVCALHIFDLQTWATQ